MDEDLTPEQKKQLKTWAFQRDAHLKNIADLKVEEDGQRQKNLSLADSNTEIITKINISLGRLGELEKKEEERKVLVSFEVFSLEKQKSTLQSEIPSLEREILAKKSELSVLIQAIELMESVHNKIFSKTSLLDQVFENVKKIGDENISKIVKTFEDIKISSKELIDKNNENVKQTGIILEKLPRYIFELEKPIPIRRPIVGPVNTTVVKPKLTINPQ